MGIAAEGLAQATTVTTEIAYTLKPDHDQPLQMVTSLLPKDSKIKSNITFKPAQISLRDMRTAPSSFNLRDNGFELVDFAVHNTIKWDDKQEVKPPAISAYDLCYC